MDTDPRIFQISNVERVAHGVGSLALLPELLESRQSRRVLVVSTASLVADGVLIRRIENLLGERFVGLAEPISSHTPVETVRKLEEAAGVARADAIVAIGGSSVSDAAKIAALRLTGATPAVTSYGGQITRGGAPSNPSRPLTLIVIPTTLSAGEFRDTGGAVDGTSGEKIMIMDDRMIPWAVILDPEATLWTPWRLWASTGIKALDHAAETIWGTRAHPFADVLAVEAIKRLVAFLPRTQALSGNLEARLECLLAAWMSIFTMKTTLIHLSHIIEHNMGAYWGLSHGITSCIALPTVMGFLAEESPTKVAMVARALVDQESAESDAKVAKAGAEWLRHWIEGLGLPVRMRELLPDRSGFEAVARHSVTGLEAFGYVPEGRETTIMNLLEKMW